MENRPDSYYSGYSAYGELTFLDNPYNILKDFENYHFWGEGWLDSRKNVSLINKQQNERNNDE